ncbi:TPA: DUF905 domain-containing protein [Escherichia coli HVH 101 (4-6859844)]|nr:DUF905 domain-containing protein [Escherichia coli HVH 101 (4-6859844)]
MSPAGSFRYRNVFTEDDQGTYSRLVIRNAEGQLRW